jgi:hypothetical protein
LSKEFYGPGSPGEFGLQPDHIELPDLQPPGDIQPPSDWPRPPGEVGALPTDPDELAALKRLTDTLPERGKFGQFIKEFWSAPQYSGKARELLDLLAGEPAEWQVVPVAGEMALEAAEVQKQLREIREDLVVHEVTISDEHGRREFAVLAKSEVEPRSLREVVTDMAKEVAISSLESAIATHLGVPWLPLLHLPSTATGAVLYAVEVRKVLP